MKRGYDIYEGSYIYEDGKLVQFDRKGIYVNISGEVMYAGRSGCKVYMSPESFEKDEVYSCGYTVPDEVEMDEQGYIHIWQVVDGHLRETWERRELNLRGDGLFPVLYEDEYVRREEALKRCEYIEQLADGREVRHVGIVKRLSLTDEQRALVRAIEGLLEEARGKGLRFLSSNANDVYVINVGEARVVYDDCSDGRPSGFARLDELEKMDTRGIVDSVFDDTMVGKVEL